MSVAVEKLEKNMAKLTIEVSAEELEKATSARCVNTELLILNRSDNRTIEFSP